MKKIIFINVLSLLTLTAVSQQFESSTSAIKGNPPATTAKQIAKPADLTASSISDASPAKTVAKAADNSGSLVQTSPAKAVAANKTELTGSTVEKPVAKTVAKVADNSSNSTNSGLKMVNTEKPASISKEPGSLSNGIKPGQPVETPTAKPVEVITTNATPGSSESIITKLATVGVAGTTTPVETKATPVTAKMPEAQLNNQLKVQPEEEIKPSVNPVAPKLPVVPMQTSEKTKNKN
jgi:hypothetical protein